jgi:hypothetical protein
VKTFEQKRRKRNKLFGVVGCRRIAFESNFDLFIDTGRGGGGERDHVIRLDLPGSDMAE